MRSNSGRGKSSTNLRDPTIRDRSMAGNRPAPPQAKLTAPADHRKGRKH